MRWFYFLSVLLLAGCTELIEKPKNLVPEKTMAELIAEFALNDQMNLYFPNTNIENATRLTLQAKKVKANDFEESYKYYVATGDLNSILDRAQKIILQRDPEAAAFIEKKLKEDKPTGLPAQ